MYDERWTMDDERWIVGENSLVKRGVWLDLGGDVLWRKGTCMDRQI
jgi:hypothetical protein